MTDSELMTYLFIGAVVLIIAIAWYLTDLGYKAFARESAIKEALRERKKLESEEKLKAEKLKKQGIQEKLNSIGLIEQASIAQKVIESFPIADFQKLRPILNSEGEIKKAVQEFNSKLGSQYEEMLLVEFGGEEPLPIRSDYEPLLKKIMDIGYRAILKEYSLLDSGSQGDVGGQSSREISDSGTWEDIKGRIQ